MSGVVPQSVAEVTPLERLGVIAEGVGYVRDLTRGVLRVALATAVLCAGGVVVQQKFEAQERTNAKLAREQTLNAQQLAEMQERLKRLGGIVHDLNSATAPDGVLSGESLRQVEALPGYGQTVSPELAEKAKAATVKIGMRTKTAAADGSTDWWPFCTATKVTYQGRDFLFAAAHCFTGGLENMDHGGPGSESPVAPPNAINITKQSKYEYVVLDPEVPADQSAHSEPLAFVTNIAADLSHQTDWALMEITANAKAQGVWSEIPGLEIGGAATDQEPVPSPHTLGQETVAYAMPASSNNTLITQRGRYLGRVYYPSEFPFSNVYDVIGIDPANNTTDTCDYGASGSQAMLADGSMTGPLSFRNNIGYPDGSRESSDPSTMWNRQVRLSIEDKLRLDLEPFPTLCLYSTGVSETTLPNLVEVLNDPSVQRYPSMK